MYDINQKTIFVLDHTHYFSISSEKYIPIDIFKSNNSIDSSSSCPQFSKSLWTCSVEASVEYCRIVWDLFPRGKLIRFIVSDTAAHIVNTWSLTTQNTYHVLNAMALVGTPPLTAPSPNEFSVVHGLRAAIEALAEPTEFQASLISSEECDLDSIAIPNKGRIICLTSTRNNASIKNLEEIFHNVLIQQNKLSATQKKLMHIQHCHLVIVNMIPANVETFVTSRGCLELSPFLSSEVHTSIAAEISNKLTHLIMSHYDLASTTVTGIPMKEEQNANSSANYDVEILHSRRAHTVICGNEALLPISTKEGAEYQTVTLRWCTPRSGSNSSDMQVCLAQHRVTPVDVTSRPSSCLINFLLNGRSVLLEMPRKTGGKIISHLLSARAGEIFIHSLQINRSCMEDPLSISEGPGGRVTDYRINDFASFIKAHCFVPLKSKIKPDGKLLNARERIMGRTKYFPLTYNSSLVFSLQRSVNWIPGFLRKMAKDEMDKADEVKCKENIFELYTAASRAELLPFPNINSGRGIKRAEQYKLLCSELEAIIRSHATTAHHRVILDSLQNVRAACSSNKPDIDVDINALRFKADSPLSPLYSVEDSNSLLKPSTKRSNGQRSLLDIFNAAERSQNNKRVAFSGRLCTPPGQVAKLHSNFYLKEAECQPNFSTAPIIDERQILDNNVNKF